MEGDGVEEVDEEELGVMSVVEEVEEELGAESWASELGASSAACSSSATASKRTTYCPVSVKSSRAKPAKLLRVREQNGQLGALPGEPRSLRACRVDTHRLIDPTAFPCSSLARKSQERKPASVEANCCISPSLLMKCSYCLRYKCHICCVSPMILSSGT